MSSGQRAVRAMDGPGADFLEFLAAQRADYRKGLAEKGARMGTLWSLICEGRGDAAAILELERQAHSLAGSGATFGYRDLGEGAKALELAVHQLHESGAVPSGAQRASISAAMLVVTERIRVGPEATTGLKPC